jgi:hypothetical protein
LYAARCRSGGSSTGASDCWLELLALTALFLQTALIADYPTSEASHRPQAVTA